MTQNSPDILQPVTAYINGFLNYDAHILRQAFHDGAQLQTADAGQVSSLLASAWFDKVAERKRAGQVQAPAETSILSVSQTDDVGVVAVLIRFPTHQFRDFLSLIRTEQGWKIVHKIYTYQELPAKA